MENAASFYHPPVTNSPYVRAVFLGNGSNYLTGDMQGDIFVRDLLTGTALETYLGQGGTWPTAVSPDGRFIARNSAPAIDRLLGRPGLFPVHKNAFSAAAFSPDGAWLASGGTDHIVQIWRLPSGEPSRPVGVHQHTVSHLAYSPDGRFLASDQFGFVRIWRVATEPFSRLLATEGISMAALSRDGRLLAPAGYTERSGAVTHTRVVAVATGEPAGPEIVPGGIIMDAGFAPNQKWLALSVSTTPGRSKAPLGLKPGSGNLQFWDFRSGRRMGEPIPLPSEPRGLAIHPSGNWIGVTCQAGENVEVEVATRHARVLFKDEIMDEAGQTLANGLCAYSPDGSRFIAYGVRRLHIWNRAAKRDLINPSQPSLHYFDVDFAGATMACAVVSLSSRLEFFDLRNGQEAAPSIPYANWPLLVQFSPDGRLLLSAGGTMVANIWDWRAGRLVCPELPHGDQIMGGTFIPGKPWVATGGHDGLIQFWDDRTGMLICPPIPHKGWVLQLKATPDGKTVVAGGDLGGIEILDLKALLPEPDLSPEEMRLLAEIDAAAEVLPGGDLEPLSHEAWMNRWETFRKRHPGYPGQRMDW